MNIDQSAMFYMSMDSSRQTPQTNGKLFFKFRTRFWIIGRKSKNIRTIREAWILIKVQSMCYTSMDSSQRALRTDESSSNFGIIFWINYNFFEIIVALGLCMRGGGRMHLCWSARVLLLHTDISKNFGCQDRICPAICLYPFHTYGAQVNPVS